MKYDVNDLSTADLYAMLLFVNGDANKILYDNEQGKQIIRERQKELEDEMRNRAYGCDPLKMGDSKKSNAPKTPLVPITI